MVGFGFVFPRVFCAAGSTCEESPTVVRCDPPYFSLVWCAARSSPYPAGVHRTETEVSSPQRVSPFFLIATTPVRLIGRCACRLLLYSVASLRRLTELLCALLKLFNIASLPINFFTTVCGSPGVVCYQGRSEDHPRVHKGLLPYVFCLCCSLLSAA